VNAIDKTPKEAAEPTGRARCKSVSRFSNRTGWPGRAGCAWPVARLRIFEQGSVGG
jgi:hypothetical protein